MGEAKEREAFIDWALENRFDITTSWGEIFADPMTQYVWEGWKARAANAATQGITSTTLARSIHQSLRAAGLPVAEETVRKALQEADDGK